MFMKRSFETKCLIIMIVLSISAILLLALVSLLAEERISVAVWSRVSDLGTETFYIAAGLAIYYMISPSIGFFTIFSLVLSGSLNSFLKDLLAMPRPSNPKIPVEGYGFPSGHAQNTTVFWEVFTLLTRSSCVTVLSILLISIVSYSRIYLNVHFVHDVVGGVVIGLLLSLALYIFHRRVVNVFYRDLVIVATSITATLLVFAYNHDVTVLKLSGVSLGALIHLMLLSKRNYSLPTPNISRRIVSYLVAMIVILAILYATRGVASTSLIATYIVYVFIGSLIPVLYVFLIKSLAQRSLARY